MISNIKRIEKKIEEVVEPQKNEVIKEQIDLNKYTANEIKEYMCYKMLLEIANESDTEYKKALEVVEDRVIKRLVKRTCSQSSSSIRTNNLSRVIPALLTKISIVPNSACIASMFSFTAFLSAISNLYAFVKLL